MVVAPFIPASLITASSFFSAAPHPVSALAIVPRTMARISVRATIDTALFDLLVTILFISLVFLLFLVYHACKIAGTKTVIYIDHADSACAGRPPITLGRAPSIPAIAMITLAVMISSIGSSARSLCIPETPTS